MPSRLPSKYSTTIENPEYKFLKQITTGDFSELTQILKQSIPLQLGVNITNFTPGVNVLISHSNCSHASKTGFMLKPGESVFIECGNLNNVKAVNETLTGSVSLQVEAI